MNQKQIHILGCKVDNNNISSFQNIINGYLNTKKFHHLVTLNPEITLKGKNDSKYKKILNNAELSVTDGIGLKIASIILSRKIVQRITGREVVEILCKQAIKNNKTLYLLGGVGGVAKQAKEYLLAKYSGLKIVGAEEGIESDKFSLNTPDLVDRINKSGADILLVAFGSPKQEEWIDFNREKLNHIKIAVGVGGIFDYYTGVVSNPPAFIKRVGLEWLFRLFTQPKRWKRIFNATFVFMYEVIMWRLSMLFIYRKNVVGFIQKNNQVLLVSPAWSDTIQWQFPQGGIDKHEQPSQAIIREMSEELGTNKFKIIKQLPSAYRYKWPRYYQVLRGKKGQTQDIFHLEFTGEDKDIDLTKEGEITDWKWVDIDRVIEELAPIRRGVGKIASNWIIN